MTIKKCGGKPSLARACTEAPFLPDLPTAEAVQHEEAITLVSSGVAHDFNNLLAGIFGYIDIARSCTGSSGLLRENLDKAIASLYRARDLAGRLLSFSRPCESQRTLCSVADLARETVSLTLAGKSVLLKTAIASDCERCFVSSSQIGRVLSNLLVNALQAMPEGGTIKVLVENFEGYYEHDIEFDRKKYLKITIGDTGCGIAPSMLKKIFDPFVTTKKNGHGLGLSVCRSIIDEHDGFIAVDSTEGAGTEMYVYLPVATQPSAVDPVQETSVDGHRGHGKVLLMDDEEFVLDITSQALSAMGYTVECASHGEEALGIFHRAADSGVPFTLIILDLTVPGGMGGVKTCAEIRKDDPNVCVVASSGYALDPVIAHPDRYGFSAVLKKPYLKNELGIFLESINN